MRTTSSNFQTTFRARCLRVLHREGITKGFWARVQATRQRRTVDGSQSDAEKRLKCGWHTEDIEYEVVSKRRHTKHTTQKEKTQTGKRVRLRARVRIQVSSSGKNCNSRALYGMVAYNVAALQDTHHPKRVPSVVPFQNVLLHTAAAGVEVDRNVAG